MGHKKRNPVTRPKQSPANEPDPLKADFNGDSETSIVSECPSPNEIHADGLDNGGGGSGSLAAVRLECERALTAYRRGNHTKALRLMKELSQRQEGSLHFALVQRAQGAVSLKVAGHIEDPATKNRHMRAALEAARKAAELSPSSIEFAYFHASMIYEVASDGKDYEDAVKECERGMTIEAPIDPAKDSLPEAEQKATTLEGRVTQVQNDLRQLVQKCNIASISSWMKNLGNGDEKFRLIPFRRITEDPVELRLVQTRRPNEIKKALKTPEERRKEIEVRVAAARLMQQKSEVPQVENGSYSLSLTGQKVSGEKRRSNHMRKNGSSAERRDLVRSFWNSISDDTKREFLRVQVSDLKEHFGSLKEGLANDVLSEALFFAETHRTWKFWECCKCSEIFADSESYLHHVGQEHIGTLLPKLQLVVPEHIDDEWVEMLLNHSWKPLDALAAVKMVQNQSKCKDTNCVNNFSLRDNVDYDDCFKDTPDSLPEEGSLGDNCTDCHGERTSNKQIPNSESSECREANGSVQYSSVVESWPLLNDPECAKLLERIRAVFEVLIKNKCFTKSHLSRVKDYALRELQTITSGSQLHNNGVKLSPAFICFLEETQLKKIQKYLQDVAHSCGLGTRYSEKSSNLKDDANTRRRSLEFKERIVLSGDSSFLLLDEGLLWGESTPFGDHHGLTKIAVGSNANGVPADFNSLLSWVFAGPSSGEELASWMHMKGEKVRQGVEIVQRLRQDFYQLQNLCERKCEHLTYEEALQVVENLCLEEGKRRESMREFLQQSFETVLKKRRDELCGNEPNEMFTGSRVEYDVIVNVLKEAESVSVNQFGYEEIYSGVDSQLCDLESGEDDEWRTKEYMHRGDTCVEMALQRQKDQLYQELSKIDARLMRSVTEMQQMELKLEPIASHDYQSILSPFLKSYLRVHLEDLAEKDATEKSDTAREAFLAELALDAKKTPKGGNDSLRQTQDKSKDKKKNKDCRKPKDSKVTGVSELQAFQVETDESVSSSFPVASDDETMITLSVNGDDLKRQKEDIRRKIELEEEERKLEETLEYQRRIENEAKQKHVAEQLKKANQTYLEKVTERHEPGPGGIAVHEQFIPFVQDLANDLEGFPAGTPTHSAPVQSLIGSSSELACTEQQANILQGLPNEGIAEDGYTPSDRRGGRKVRRQKSAAKLSDGKHQFLPSGREIVEVKSTGLGGALKEGDNEFKSLRQLRAEDDEERFQADLEKAVQESLDTFQAPKKLPSVSSLKTMQPISGEVVNGDVPNGAQAEGVSEDDVLGTGLKNEVGEYNCFLNVIIQSLWHIRRFRDEFLQRSSSVHFHVGDPCVVCALYEIFSALSIASTDTRRKAVAPTSLRVALSNLYPDSTSFQEAQMNDASEALHAIFDCLHKSFARGSDTERGTSFMGSWDCIDSSCIAHAIFGMDVFDRMNCYNCGLETRHFKYTTFFHNINASALRTMKVMCAESSFDELLNLVEMNDQLPCDPGALGCGKLNHTHHILSSPPHVFTTVLGWQNSSENVSDIKDTLEAIDTEIDISVLYRGLDPKKMRSLVSVVCYYGRHYHCFAYSHDHERWIMYDDQTVKVIGSWDDVISMCEKGHLQPQVLFYEAIN